MAIRDILKHKQPDIYAKLTKSVGMRKAPSDKKTLSTKGAEHLMKEVPGFYKDSRLPR